MCNDYEQHIDWAQYCAMMQAAELGIPTHKNELDLPGPTTSELMTLLP